MSITIKKVPWAWYGPNPNRLPLPEGWHYIEKPGYWLLAQSPDGNYWFAGETHICRLKFASEWDVLKSQVHSWFNRWITPFNKGDIYADTRNVMEIKSLA